MTHQIVFLTISLTLAIVFCQVVKVYEPCTNVTSFFFSCSTEDPPPVQVVSILYTVIPCLLFAIVFSSVVIFVCWRCHKQIMYQAAQSAATPLVPVAGKPSVSRRIRKELENF